MNSSTGGVQLAALMGADQGRSGGGGGKDAGGRLARQRLARTGRGRLGGADQGPGTHHSDQSFCRSDCLAFIYIDESGSWKTDDEV